ncbi:MAG: DUF1232 domain-containing protein [Candidatus Latescibacteria bacterium]|nr:DUF1232 domain-containing protein [Candidatus Latescibacterota bacterium]MBT4136539.1 DUF1232 domain-containing protein [Candidatus Latescibacterota bacterium]MBT5832377.1 DUF1232 domain-containing protein [Candidatus Latescibacterota bacterium]
MRALFALFNLLRMRGVASIILKLPQYLRLSWRLLWDQRTPTGSKVWVMLAVAYAISPLDFIPDFVLPIIGYGEDLALVILSLRNLINSSPPELVKEHAKNIAEKK